MFRADSQDGEVLGNLTVPAQADWTVYESKVNAPAGVHALWMEFKGAEASDETELMRVDWFEFSR